MWSVESAREVILELDARLHRVLAPVYEDARDGVYRDHSERHAVAEKIREELAARRRELWEREGYRAGEGF